MLDQCRKVVPSRSQWRQRDREDAQAVVQVAAEFSGVHHLRQVPVGRGDDPHVRPDRLVPADPLKPTILQHPEHLRLGQRRHVADLVEEQRPAVALLEDADPLAIGAGERPLLMAEQLALEQGLGDRGAVDGQEGAGRAATVLVDCPGHQFLARAALAQDQRR